MSKQFKYPSNRGCDEFLILPKCRLGNVIGMSGLIVEAEGEGRLDKFP